MKSTKKMYLLDEMEYDRLVRPLAIRNELSWKRPLETRAKNEEHRTMRSILDDESLPDDIKSKSYNQSLSRFLNTKSKIEDVTIQPDQNLQQAQPPPAVPTKRRKTIKAEDKKKKKAVLHTKYSPMHLRKNRKRALDHTLWTEY